MSASGEPLGVADMPLPVAELITGYGLARSTLRWYEVRDQDVQGERVVVEGFGAVGGPCALYLARAGMPIVGIMDREKSLLSLEGLSAGEVEVLVRNREDKLLPRGDARLAWGPERTRLWDLPADVFVSAAASGTLDEDALVRLECAGVHTIACGANQPFRESRIGATRVQRMADQRFTVIPDVVANCGMARAFSYLMEDGAGTEVRAHLGARTTGLLGASLGLALDRSA